MLNELVIVERVTRDAGIKTVQRHPDVMEARPMPTLLVQLDDNGQVASVRPVPRQITPWTLRNGQHNSFPFVQPKYPLWSVPQNPENDANREAALDKKKTDRRKALLDLADNASFDVEAFDSWPGTGLINRLRERRQQLVKLRGTESDVVLATIDCFLLASDRNRGGGPEQLLQQVTERILKELARSPQNDWLEIAIALLIGSFDNKTKEWLCSGALLFEASGKNLSIFDSKLVSSVSDALRHFIPEVGDSDGQTMGICALTGTEELLLNGNFPQPKLPTLGQTYLFAKNRDIRANDRYGRFSVDAMPVGQDTVIRLAAAFKELTSNDRKNLTWRAIPGEAPKQSDLLLAFMEAVPDAPVAESLAEEDFSEEVSDASSNTIDSVAAFEKRTERMIELVKAKVGNEVAKVQLAVFRKVDPANRKVVYADTLTAGDLYQAATTWVAGERNVPPWVTLPVLKKGESKPRPMLPPHVAPLGLIVLSKQIFLRNGKRPDGKKKDQFGLPAGETLRFFLDPVGNTNFSARRRAKRVLRLMLTRRAPLVTGTAHALRRGFDFAKGFDVYEALRTVTLLGTLLHKLSRKREVYMHETAFKLGQLLAAADVVHAGYCADVRGGAVPPALLGNQVFAMAQSAPAKALATLCRRWKPYDGWAKKASREPNRAGSLIAGNKKDEQQRGWDIKKALRHVREMGPLAAELASELGDCRVDDVFRAELLLGYIAGLPKSQKEELGVQEGNIKQEE